MDLQCAFAVCQYQQSIAKLAEIICVKVIAGQACTTLIVSAIATFCMLAKPVMSLD